MIAVKIDTGISDCVAHRAIVSTTTINNAPKTIHEGMSLRLSFPKHILEICGINKPTHPITPHKATIEVVIKEEKKITRILICLRSIPKDLASSSLNDKAFNRYRMEYKKITPTKMHGIPIMRDFIVTDEKLPINQNVMTGKTSFGSATYFTNDTKALNKEEITIPANITIIIDLELYPFVFVTRNTKAIALKPKAKADNCVPTDLNPNKIPKAAPKEAPLAQPRVSGVAKGFENSA